jgi:triacylglycerol lipase
MGGLDARYLIAHLEAGNRVRSLTTLSTPHRGSYLADLLGMVPGMSRLIPAIPDLSVYGAARFNRETPDNSGTSYLSVPCRTRLLQCCPAMWIPFLILRLKSGPNDGQVPLESAKWGRILEEVEADHIQVLGMRYGLNALQTEHHLDLYGRISETIAEIE